MEEEEVTHVTNPNQEQCRRLTMGVIRDGFYKQRFGSILTPKKGGSKDSIHALV
jgi:hypothetical protein